MFKIKNIFSCYNHFDHLVLRILIIVSDFEFRASNLIRIGHSLSNDDQHFLNMRNVDRWFNQTFKRPAGTRRQDFHNLADH